MGSGVGVAEESCDPSLSALDVSAVFRSYFCCLGDYSMDSRGDVGAGVREAVMTGMATVMGLLADSNTHLLSPEM